MNDTEFFDQYAENYEQELSNALAVSGADREYFAEGRVAWLQQCLLELGERPHALLDFGCGDGATTPLLMASLNAESAIGVDVSEKSIEIARSAHSKSQITYFPIRDFPLLARIDLAYCNGVFHHIPLNDRARAVAFIHASLRPGGVFSFWENNPWNPGTRYVMSRCRFDRDAITLTPPQARALLRAGRFEIVRTDFRFIFPQSLRALRKLEDVVYRLPFGAQYQVLCRKMG